MTTVNFVTLSHSSAGYDSYDKLNRMFTGEKRRVVRSRIQDLTDYAPDQLQYMFKNDITCKSLFRVGDDIVLLEAYPQRDTRVFVECKVATAKAQSQKNKSDLAEYILDEADRKIYNEDFDSTFKEAFLLALLSDRTHLYCLAGCPSAVDAVRRRIYSCGAGLLSLGSYIEVMKQIPPIKYTVATCICVTGEDRSNFMDKISKNNSIVFDMTGRQVRISVNIPSPKYSQNAVRELVAEYKKNNRTFDEFVEDLDKFVREFDINYSNEGDGMMNEIMYSFMRRNAPNCISRVTATAAEREQLIRDIEEKGRY